MRSVTLTSTAIILMGIASACVAGGQREDAKVEGYRRVATGILGPDAVLLRYGDLSHSGFDEVLAVVKLNVTGFKYGCTPISHLVILRRENSEWKVVLDAAKHVRNEEGYLGLDYIDDSDLSPAKLCVEIAESRSDGAKGFTIYLNYLTPDGEIDGIPIQVSWNSKVRRYQEYTDNENPEGFRSEIKDPKHISARKPAH